MNLNEILMVIIIKIQYELYIIRDSYEKESLSSLA